MIQKHVMITCVDVDLVFFPISICFLERGSKLSQRERGRQSSPVVLLFEIFNSTLSRELSINRISGFG
ncbi:unnamed protein product [Microthlaspi erraticum]|uniref:Uncharacterized protein n=1 Tax=Microthlaspi erraticum TaxID=1685480 RepID=A0A6D2HNU7_9BRAS|nr:unnamed protein product [Microthlaspi erraticum]